MNEPYEEDKPIPQVLKVMQLMDCTPGHVGDPVNGQEIAILSFAHLDEMEQPLMLDLKDTKNLAVFLLKVLSHHGDQTATRVLEEYYPEKA